MDMRGALMRSIKCLVFKHPNINPVTLNDDNHQYFSEYNYFILHIGFYQTYFLIKSL